MPAVLGSAIKHVVIHAGMELWGGRNEGILIHTDQGKAYIRDGFMEELFVHEAAHTALDMSHSDSPGWRGAQRRTVSSSPPTPATIRNEKTPRRASSRTLPCGIDQRG